MKIHKWGSIDFSPDGETIVLDGWSFSLSKGEYMLEDSMPELLALITSNNIASMPVTEIRNCHVKGDTGETDNA
ncbi:MAG: hypothetical protein KAS32_30585 [Candidatus Peribacteraceae bacterium]|nr:hypothetical protein [Candidatus Peribacteraceae bacterium]